MLHKLLKAYASYNVEISYCQGMNYVMGFLYICIQNEEATFKAFTSLIDKFFQNFFSKDLAKLKLLFYQFDHCLNLFLPKIADHFKVK